jgi:two-component system invasion response regulator UvrY
MKILIADDHAVFRHGLKDILAKRFEGATFGEAQTAQAALEAVWSQAWNVLVLDITMPGRSGLEIINHIRQAQPKLPILVLSMHPEEQYAIRVLEAGADGYVTKIKAPAELVEAIEKLLAGGKYISPAIAERLVHHLRSGASKHPHERLSNREYEVMRLIASGQSMKNIAHDLSISLQTVSTHRFRMLKKMGLRNIAELIRYAVENKLIE